MWPPWFFAFIVSIFTHKFLFVQSATQPAITKWLNGLWHAELTTSDFFRQCAFVLHDNTRQLLVQDWSLGVELKGSILIPLFVICARRKSVGLIFPMALFFLIFVGTGHYYISFIIGVLLAQYDSYWVSLLTRLGKLTRVMLFIGGLLLYQGFDWAANVFGAQPTASKYGWVMTAIGCAVILISVLGSQALQRMLNCKPFIFLGRISYSVYLLQFIIILCLLPPLVVMFNILGITQPLILLPVTIFASVAATISCAALMYHFVELPVIDFGHWLTKKIQRRSQKSKSLASANLPGSV
ncbi:MAG: acyltransferase [Limisphaerales bacterium]